MPRLLATAIFAYAGLAAAQWRYATRWLYAPTGVLWCGNAVSDPFWLLVAVVGPLSAWFAAILVVRCIKSRRWPVYAITALLTFAATSACLAYEARLLDHHGILIPWIWWMPWRHVS